MQRYLSNTVLPLAALFFCGAFLVVSQNRDVQVEIHPVEGPVSYLTGAGGNIGISAGSDGVLIVDSQFSWLAPKIEGAIHELAQKKPIYLVNTHWHGDHTGGNPILGAEALIVAHENVRARLSAAEGVEGRVADPVLPDALPDLTYNEEMSLHFNGEEIRLFHLPTAHTDGDSVVWFRGSNVVHMGDLYFSETYPYFDANSGGSILGLIRALDAVLERVPADAKIIAGHGGLTGVTELRAYRDMIEVIVSRVREATEAGMTAAEMIEGKLSEDYDADWGGSSFVPPERFIQMIAEELAG